MPPRTARYVFGFILAGTLLVYLLAIPGTRAGMDTRADGTPSDSNGSDTGVSDASVGGDTTQGSSTASQAGSRTPILRGNLNISRILEMAGEETPFLRYDGNIIKNADSQNVVKDKPTASGHPLGGLKPIYGGTVNISWLVRIQIVTAQGVPVAGATVWLIDNLGNIAFEVKTDDSGTTPPVALVEARIDGTGIRTLNPYTVVVDGGGGTQEFPMRVESDGTVIFVLRFPLEGDAAGGIAYATAVFAAIASCLVTPISFDRSRYALLVPFIPLYSKLRKEDIVGQSTRGLILDYIVTHPGEHFGAIKKALCLSNGNAVYHLRFLEKQGLIKSRLSGIYRRFYPRDFALPPDNGDAAWAG